MTSPLQLVLTVVPLAAYLYLLAIWQAGRHPRVVKGVVDVSLLALGVGGLVVFGPFGQSLVRMIFGRPSLIHWLNLAFAATLIASCLARRSSRRLVVYHVDADALEAALGAVLEPEQFEKTPGGYVDRTHSRGIRVGLWPRWQSAEIETYGRDADALLHDLEPKLRERLGAIPSGSPDVAILFFGLSALTMLVPMTGYLLSQPPARAVLRVLFERLQGG
jgi:hypothetical protein